MYKPPFDLVMDVDTPVSAFIKLAPLKPRFLLESVAIGGGRHGRRGAGRYSLIGFDPAFELRATNDTILLDDHRQPLPSSRDGIMAFLRAALERSPRLLPDVDGLPFRGGLFGATAYDLAHHLDRIRISDTGHSTSDHPLLAYTAPRALLVIDHVTRLAALLHAGGEVDQRAFRDEVLVCLRGTYPSDLRSGGDFTPARASLDRPSFESSVRRAQAHIVDGDVFQLVLSIAMDGEHSLEPIQVYRALRLLNPSPYLYFFDFDDLQIVGSSPEPLVYLDGNRVHLRPVAGTRPRGIDSAADQALAATLAGDAKEAAEHVMLVDLARNDLGRVAQPGTIRVSPYRAVEYYSHVMHLVSGVSGNLCPSADVFDVFAATFPAGTVSGAPKIRALELINAIEPVPRGLYAGTVGFFGHDQQMDQALTIRTLVFQGNRYRYQAGAGIVADSIPAQEYDEVQSKAAVMRAALELAKVGL